MTKEIDSYIRNLMDFIEFLKGDDRVYIQAHNFPDHDAVASAFALQTFMKIYGVECRLVYDGEIQRDSLKRVIADLAIDIRKTDEYDMKENDRVIIVDGCKWNKNVTDLIGNEVGVIDHHRVSNPEDVEFCDIRPEWGACVSIIASYYFYFNQEIPPDVATAMMIGINTDTAHLTRGVTEHDLKCFTHCYEIADVSYFNSIMRNYICVGDLEHYAYLIRHVEYFGTFGFCYFPEGCSQNLLGILADFILALEEIDFVVLCARNGGRINFSLRNEVAGWNGSEIIQNVLRGIGFGGGHGDRAGGIIKDCSLFDKDEILRRFVSELEISLGRVGVRA